MLKAKSLYHLIVYSIVFIIILISFFTFTIINNAHEELQEKIHTLKTDYTNSQKALLKNHIDYVIKFIDYYYNQNKDLKSVNQIKKDVLLAINKLKLSDNPNEYIFIYDFDGNVVLSSNEKLNVGKNFLNFKDSSGKYPISELIKESQKNGGGYVNYFWTKPEASKETNKLSFVNSYSNWKTCGF